MRADLTIRTPAGRDVDLRVHAHAGASLADVDIRLRAACGVTTDAPFWTPDAILSTATPLGEVGLRDGCRLTVGPPTHRAVRAQNGLHVSVVGGPDAGRSIALRAGTTRIGRGPDCDLQLADPDVSRHHVELTASGSGIRATDAGSRNGTVLEGADLSTSQPVAPGQVLLVGDSLIAIAGAHDPPALLRPIGDGSVRVLTSGGPLPAVRAVEFALPTDETPTMIQRVPWIAATLPLLTGMLFAILMRSAQFLLFSLLAPLTMIGTALGDRVTVRRRSRRHRSEQRHRAAATIAAITLGLSAETALRRRRDPDPAAVAAIARLPTSRLWERSSSSIDLLRVRVGSADLPSVATVRRGPTSEAAGTLWRIPVVVDLADGPLGITGPLPIARAIARWVVVQLVTLGPPGRIELAALLGDDSAAWRWLRWLPHLSFAPGVTHANRRDLLKELARVIAEREAERPATWRTRVVVVVDCDNDHSSALTPVLERGAAVGVSAIWVRRPAAGVPPACAHLVSTNGDTGSRITVVRSEAGGQAGDPINAIADQVSLDWADGLARALAPLHDGTADTTPSGAPGLLRAPGMDLDGIESRWEATDPGLRTMLGTNASGPVWIDLVQDGPHALVAGTTGSGKSELLRTLVAGLALRLPPECLSFLLVDYKGGAAFAECASLPHVTGVVTDLDSQLTTRALRSLECELRRRERLFAEVAADDLDAYRVRTDGDVAVPRLVIVVDEFAALAAELPEFVHGLVAVAQRGRSLGVHLVLATQRPGTCVSPDIRANAALRIALRVAEPAESFDLIGRPDAARIAKSSPGRAVIACGDRVEDVQVSHVGRRTDDESTNAPTVELLDQWRRVVGKADPLVPTGRTDLARIVEVVSAVAHRRHSPARHAPWLPPLPESVPLASLPSDPVPARVPFGIADRPDLQDQPLEVVDLARGDAVLVAGAPRSGRSTALRAIAAAAARRLAPRDLHLYVIDCGGGALAELIRWPHCVTATCPADWDVLAELVHRLEASTLHRRRPAAPDRTNAAEPAGAHTGPAMQLVLIDGWDELVSASAERDHGRTADTAARLVAAAGSAATTIVLSGGRATLASRVASVIPARYLLRLADRADYGLAGMSPRDVPAAMPAGRALRAPDAVEVQIADVDEGPLVTNPSRHPTDGISLRPLPAALRLADVPAAPGLLRIGVSGPAGTLTGLPADATGTLLVAGPPGSGRSTALRVLLREGLRLGLPAVVAAKAGSALNREAVTCGVPVLDPDAAHTAEQVAASRLILLDDADTLLGTTVDDLLCAVLNSPPVNHLVVASACTQSVARAFRGLVAALLRDRRLLVLEPGPSDGDLLGVRLPPGPAPRPIPGRGVLVGDFTTSDGGRPRDELSWTQLADPGDLGAVDEADQPMCGYR